MREIDTNRPCDWLGREQRSSACDESSPLVDQTVVVRGGRIISVARAHVDAHAQRIDGREKSLMPGLTDRHVHVENVRVMRLLLKLPEISPASLRNEDVFSPYIANVVVQIFDLQAMSEQIARRDEIDAGRLIGPRFKTAAIIDGEPPIWRIGTTRVTPRRACARHPRESDRERALRTNDSLAKFSRSLLSDLDSRGDKREKWNPVTMIS